jgi:signal transduction histidine kinase
MDSLSKEVGIIVIGSVFLMLIALGIIILVFSYQRKQALYLQEKATLKAAFEKEILEAQLEIQELTMKHIAQEIHDNIGQTLGLAKLNLNTLSPDRAAQIPEKLANTKELVSKAITDLRTLSKSLHTEAVLSQGLTEAISTELRLIERAGVFQTAFSISGDTCPLDPQKELILFRAVQEALNNAIKHSGADRIEVHLHYTPAELQVAVQDNGKGFIPQASGGDEGSGLRNMRNRAKLIGGSFHIESREPGTQVRLHLPILQA